MALIWGCEVKSAKTNQIYTCFDDYCHSYRYGDHVDSHVFERF